MMGTVYKDRAFIGEKAKKGKKQNKREMLSLIKYKTKR